MPIVGKPTNKRRVTSNKKTTNRVATNSDNNSNNSTESNPNSNLVPYTWFGLSLAKNSTGKEAVGDCPFCSRSEKFSINIATGQWRCLVCQTGSSKGGGNILTFIRLFYELCLSSNTSNLGFSSLAENRGIKVGTLISWGIVNNVLTNEWLVPAFARTDAKSSKSGESNKSSESGKSVKSDIKLVQLYRYASPGKGRKPTLMATPTVEHYLIGMQLYNPKKSDIYFTEGPWDAMRLWEMLASTKYGEKDKLLSTEFVDKSLLSQSNVIALPSCTVFPSSWVNMFNGMDVNILFDNDHPRTHPKTGQKIPPAAFEATKRVARLLHKTTSSTFYLNWGEEGYDLELESGYDVRDLLKSGIKGMETLSEKLDPVPDEWFTKESLSQDQGLQPKFCDNWETLVAAWRKALKWTPGLDCALSVMLASCASTMTLGEQLWIKIISPASGGKSTLCEALSINKKYTLAKSTIRGFHSGYKGQDGGDEDNSLIAQVNGRTLITKDGDTLLQAPNLTQILSEARDLYDSVSRTHYRNAINRDYEGIRMTWLLSGTSSLRLIDSSELGERFLDCVIMDRIDEELEEDILWRVAHRTAKQVSQEYNGEATSQYSPELMEAMQLTGGYISWLRENVHRVGSNIEFSKKAKTDCIHIAKLVAYMRARPSKHQSEHAERELAARLVSQHIKLASCLALVLNRPSVDEEVKARVRKVGLDTSRGLTLDIARRLYLTGSAGLESRALSLFVHCGEADLRKLLRFMKRIGIVELTGKKTRKAWKLTDRIQSLLEEAAKW